ncbi:MAG TPA: hypothetical protein VF144_18770, partial [Chitinophagaceae bacterium]
RFRKFILIFWFSLYSTIAALSQTRSESIYLEFLGDSILIQCDLKSFDPFLSPLSENSITDFYKKLESSDYEPIVEGLLNYRDNEKLDDWLYYQLIRKMAQQISPKANNYYSYTIYKWFFLTKSGYDAMLRTSDHKILFYVQSDENIYNIPSLVRDDKQYVCLNYHDYGNEIDFEKEHFRNAGLPISGAKRAFTYKVNHLPDLKSRDYVEKDLQFTYYQNEYHFNIKLNPQIKNIFTNYPAGDYSNQFSIPLSRQTHNSLIPQLKNALQSMNTFQGVDYLMRFTRYAFLFEKDTVIYGREKRLSAEETLLYDYSDCEDRAALFLYLVKEIYDLPMIVLAYPGHVTVAVKFDKPVGTPIVYNGEKYTICEPTPQKKDLHVGKMLPQLRKEKFEIAYVYQPLNK